MEVGYNVKCCHISHYDTRHYNQPPPIVQNFINEDSEGTSNSVGTCMLPEDGAGNAKHVGAN
jgi:hypothetical protein